MKLAGVAARFFLFVLIGVLTAAVGELQYSVFIRGDWANWFGSMAFNALYLAAAFGVTRLLFQVVGRGRVALLLCAALAAGGGLLVEWFLIGNSPWGNPDASQIGMAAYWACLVVAPLILVEPDAYPRPLRRAVVAYGLVYTALALLAHWLLPSGDWRYAYHLWSVIVGYVGWLALCVVGYLYAHRMLS